MKNITPPTGKIVYYQGIPIYCSLEPVTDPVDSSTFEMEDVTLPDNRPAVTPPAIAPETTITNARIGIVEEESWPPATLPQTDEIRRIWEIIENSAYGGWVYDMNRPIPKLWEETPPKDRIEFYGDRDGYCFCKTFKCPLFAEHKQMVQDFVQPKEKE